MSTITTIAFTRVISQELAEKKVTVEIRPDEEKAHDSVIWEQIQEILNQSLIDSGITKQRVETTRPEKEQTSGKILVAPGILLGNKEYEERFGNIDLEYYRKQMPPELFKVFVRHTGCIPGTPKVDVVELTSDFEG